MLQLYKIKSRDQSTEKVESWLKKNGIVFKTIFPNMITEEHVYDMLKVANYGFKDILVSQIKGKKRWQEVKLELELDLNEISIQKMVSVIAKNPQLLKKPILYNEKILLSGFNADEIRAFLPRSRRKVFCNDLINYGEE